MQRNHLSHMALFEVDEQVSVHCTARVNTKIANKGQSRATLGFGVLKYTTSFYGKVPMSKPSAHIHATKRLRSAGSTWRSASLLAAPSDPRGQVQ